MEFPAAAAALQMTADQSQNVSTTIVDRRLTMIAATFSVTTVDKVIRKRVSSSSEIRQDNY